MTCRRCTDCPDVSHHWMEDFDDGPWEHAPEPRPIWACKHCAFTMPMGDIDEDPQAVFEARKPTQAAADPYPYDLWCVDRGPGHDPATRYLGPYDTDKEAARVAREDSDREPVLVPCRRIRASEIANVSELWEYLRESVDDNAPESAPEGAWSMTWDDQLVRDTGGSGAPEALAQILDEHFTVDMWILHPDARPQREPS